MGGESPLTDSAGVMEGKSSLHLREVLGIRGQEE